MISTVLTMVLLAVPDGGLSFADGGAAKTSRVLPRPFIDAGAPSAASVDDQARFLAGLPVDAGSVLAPLTERAAWKAHAEALDAGWTKLEQKRLTSMAQWAAAEIAPNITPTLPVVYFFGGPDLISVDAIYADAPLYVLCGLERPGGLPALETLAPADVELGLTALRNSLRTTIEVSYFVTAKLGPDLQKSQLRGVLPLLYVFLARHGDTVLATEAVSIDPTGALVAPSANDAVTGWRIRFQRKGVGPVRELLYLRDDLGNDALTAHPGLLRFLEPRAPFNSYLKAASFILHDRRFSVARSFLLDHSASVLQDDSGIPFKYFKDWDVTLFGQYTAPRTTFKAYLQADMQQAWAKGPTRPLPFTTGYKHTAGYSHLVLARKRSGDAGVPLPQRSETGATTDAGPRSR